MIHIIHGDDTVSSQNKLSETLKDHKNVTLLQGEKVSGAELQAAFKSQDLFAVEKCIVIEKFLKLKKAEMDMLIDLIASKENEATLILWHNTELSKLALSKFKNAKVEVFMLPKLFFTFLDTFAPQNLKRELEIMSQMDQVEPEQVFYALIKRVRQLMYISMNVVSEETAKMSPWQVGKLKDQSRLWKISELESMYAKLFEIEIAMKSGGLVLPLRQELDRVLIQELN